MASGYTNKRYKRNQWLLAISDLDAWIADAKSKITIRTR